MNFIPIKRCNPQLSRRIGDVVGYIPNEYYLDVLDSVFSGTVESWSDLPSNVQDIILMSERNRRMVLDYNKSMKRQTLERIDTLKKQLDDIKSQLTKNENATE